MVRVAKNNLVKVAALIAIAPALLTIPASAQDRENRPRRPAAAGPQLKTASEAYWDAVRATTGPIGFPQAVPDDEFTRWSGAHSRGLGPAIFVSVPFVAPPAPVYVPVPVYVPGPPVYVPLPPAAAPDTANAISLPAQRRPEKFYVIPGCYGGNKPPQPKALPAGCDIKKLRISTW